MIFDKQNMFFDKKPLAGSEVASDIINVGKGEAGDPMTVVTAVEGGAAGATYTGVLKTGTEVESGYIKSGITLSTSFRIPGSFKLPRGNKGLLQMTVDTTDTTGKLTAGLVLDDDVR